MDYSNYSVIALFRNRNGISERVFADIALKGCEKDPIEAYIVMINPGSCEEDLKSGRPAFSFYEDEVLYAKKDPAQRCVINFMEECKIKKIRIVNLSNEREPKLDLFLKKMKENPSKQMRASIFSNDPTSIDDRRKYMRIKAPCILSWGKEGKLKELKKQAYECLIEEGYDTIAVEFSKADYSCKYIKPWTKAQQDEVRSELVKKWNNR